MELFKGILNVTMFIVVILCIAYFIKWRVYEKRMYKVSKLPKSDKGDVFLEIRKSITKLVPMSKKEINRKKKMYFWLFLITLTFILIIMITLGVIGN